MMQFSEILCDRLIQAERVVFLSGAGMSAASGVPTFRGKDGLWNNYRPQDLANPLAFQQNPELVWAWYQWRRDLIDTVEPNIGHTALAELEVLFLECTIVTQNVDQLHQRAGSQRVIELHGNIMRNKCCECDYRDNEKVAERLSAEELPRCPECKALLRPDVVWFGEMLPREALLKAQQAASEAELFFVLGTSGTVAPASSFPYLAKYNGAYVVEMNPEETPLSESVDERLAIGTEKALPLLLASTKDLKNLIS